MSNLEHKRHTLAHIMAKAIVDAYPHAKLTLGPAIDTGFYYDVDFSGGPALGDQWDTIEMVAFPATYAEQKDLFVPGQCVAIKGKLTIRNDAPSIAIDKAKALTSTL